MSIYNPYATLAQRMRAQSPSGSPKLFNLNPAEKKSSPGIKNFMDLKNIDIDLTNPSWWLTSPGRAGTTNNPNDRYSYLVNLAKPLGVNRQQGQYSAGGLADASRKRLAELYLGNLRQQGYAMPSYTDWRYSPSNLGLGYGGQQNRDYLRYATEMFNTLRQGPNPEWEAQRQREQAEQQYFSSWPTYQEAMSEYELDPLQQVYSGQRYSQSPLDKQEYDYLRLMDKFYGAGQEFVPEYKRKASGYQVGTPGYYDSYDYMKKLESDLKERVEKERQRQQSLRQQAEKALSGFPTPGGQRFVHFLGPRQREALGVSESDVARSRSAYQSYLAGKSAWDQRRRQNDYQNAMAAQRGQEARSRQLQSAAARGFYQTPYAYQNL